MQLSQTNLSRSTKLIFLAPSSQVDSGEPLTQTRSTLKYPCPDQEHLTNLLTKAINSTFSSPLTKTIIKASTSHVILLHKAGCTDEVTNYRPISLLNADWKLLSSILTHCLNKALPLLLGPNQHGFTPHRQATEAVLYLYATYDKIFQQSLQSDLLSVDFKKAFDFVFHQYLLALLQCIGFPPKFLNMLAAFFHNGTARL